MTLKYDDSLPTLVRIALAAQLDLASEDTIVVRDASGRLGIVCRMRQKSNNLSRQLKTALGAYALPEPVLPAALFETINQAKPRPLLLLLEGSPTSLWLADRRVVGMDWLGDFLPPTEGPPRLVFGSLKGGVGRTTALAVLAADLANHQYKVLCVDLDLEAPGLGSTLLRHTPRDDRRPKFGVLDYLVENGLGGIADEELFDHIGISHFSDGLIHVIPAVGRITDENPGNMVGKLARGLTEDMTQSGQRLSVAQQMREMVDRFVARDNYDAVLVDARAGLSETTAATWLGLGASKLVLFGTDQSQTFQGYQYALSHLVQTLGIPEEDWRSRLTFVQSKAPNLTADRAPFRERLHELCREKLYDVDEGPEADFAFNFAFSAEGPDVPHDAKHIEYHPTYEAFEPLANGAVLKPEAYRGPFSAFLDRAWELLGLERDS